jgi:hypothetical protein
MMRKKAKSNEVTEKDVARARRKAFFGKIRKTIKNLIKDAPQIGAFGMTSIGKFFFESIVLCFFAAFLMINISGCGAVGSALDWGSRGREFKSRHSDQQKTAS